MEMLLFGLRVELITCRKNTSFLHASIYVNKHWRHPNHTKTFFPASVSGFEYILPFEGLTTHGTSQEQLLTNNSRCGQTLNTMSCSVLDLFMLTFSNPFYCFLSSGLPLCSFKIQILDTLKISKFTRKSWSYFYSLFYCFFHLGLANWRCFATFTTVPLMSHGIGRVGRAIRCARGECQSFAVLLMSVRREPWPPES